MTLGGAGLTSSACRHKGARTRPPYSSAPTPAALHAAMVPTVNTLKISRAKVQDELTPSAQFAALIQAPGRIHASLFLKGQEIMSLVANEQGYGLRYAFDRGLTPGYYHGTKDRCAVQAFLGAPIEVDDLIALLLGGGPTSFRADSILEQGWDARAGAERVVFYDRVRQRSLTAHFLWRDDRWVLFSASGYRYEQRKPKWEWGVRHLDFGRIQGAPHLPSRIKFRRIVNGARKVLELKILEATTAVDIDTSPAQEGDDTWGDEEDWESADGESQDMTEQDTASAKLADTGTPTPEPASSIPSVFIPNPEGLIARGPLCTSPDATLDRTRP